MVVPLPMDGLDLLEGRLTLVLGKKEGWPLGVSERKKPVQQEG